MTTHPPTAPTQTWLSRVQALLAKAESTEFPDEAEALVAKAQDLMARHAISEAMVAAERARHGSPSDRVTSRRVVVTAPYASAKRTLLGAVANANGCRCVSLGEARGGRPCQVFGHESDLDNVETLFASLSVQAVRAMVTAAVPPGDTPRRFRHAFLLAYATRIGQRLHEAGAAARSEALRDDADPTRLSLALRDRDAAVDEALRDAYPRTRTARATATSGAGWSSGRRAADRAGLGQRRIDSSTRSLGAG
jgi:hypothetical protein